MPYIVTQTDLPNVLILEPKVFGDDGGFFFESFNQRDFQQATGLDTAPTTLAGVRQMIKALRAGRAVGLLPDQVLLKT
jgi:dTDP-4-dehydrorhamnose 3,5-epimerase-like enzyme